MILIIDNGSQYTHLIKRNCRELGFDADMIYSKAPLEKLNEFLEEGVVKIILSGGPSSVYSEAPNLSSDICNRIKESKLKTPLLGICYGHQMIAHIWGAKVAKGASAEYGLSEIDIEELDERGEILFKGVPKKIRAWGSHFDEVKDIPDGFVKLAHSESCKIEAMVHQSMPIFSTQFHPEVWHTEHGEDIIRNFLEF